MAAAHLNRAAQSDFIAQRDVPPASQVGYPRIRRDLKNRSWRGLLKSIDDDAQGVGRRRR